MQKPYVHKTRPSDWYYVVAERRGMKPPWICDYRVDGRKRFRLFTSWHEAITFALTEC